MLTFKSLINHLQGCKKKCNIFVYKIYLLFFSFLFFSLLLLGDETHIRLMMWYRRNNNLVKNVKERTRKKMKEKREEKRRSERKKKLTVKSECVCSCINRIIRRTFFFV